MVDKTKGPRRRAADPLAARILETEVAKLACMPIEGLRGVWIEKFKSESPRIRSREILLRLLTARMQADVFGGHDAATERKLHEIGQALERDGDYKPKIRRELSPGVVLTREWNGVVHQVAVVADGFRHREATYKSLSEVARTITGTRWSGPRFFGLQQKKTRAATGDAP